MGTCVVTDHKLSVPGARRSNNFLNLAFYYVSSSL